jgi:ethanolamine utilization protein EutN
MKLGKVIGKVWAERKVPQLQGCRLQVIQPLSSKGEKVDFPLVVADPHNISGIGDVVVYVTSTDAVQAFDNIMTPVNASVVELVESID